MYLIRILILVICIYTLPFNVHSQCKKFIKDNCESQFEGHRTAFQGAIDIPVLMDDGSVKIPFVFNRRQDYRVVFCADELAGKVQFKLLDYRGRVVFDNKEHDMAQFWDFSFTSTSRLTIVLTIPKYDMSTVAGVDARLSEDYKKMLRECVAVAIGVK